MIISLQFKAIANSDLKKLKKKQLRNTWYSNCKRLWQKLELNILTFIFRQEDKNNWLNANKVLGFRIARSEVPDNCKILTSVDK